MVAAVSTTASASRKAIDYAEVRLNVHDVYREAMTDRNGLDECLTKLSELRDAKRTFENIVMDREMDLTADERSKHPEMSDAAMGRHLKVVYHDDSILTSARSKLNNLASDLDGLECDKNVLETNIKIAVARMNELGGYLSYLAAVKQASDTEK